MLAKLVRSFTDLPISFSLSYYWCSGFILSSLIFLQTVTGIILSFIYVAHPSLSFGWVLGESADSFFYWVVRYWHIWGVSMIFILTFVHMGRALYYSSYSKRGVWNVGFLIYLLLMIESFLGYILPWHQMSYWAAPVLTTIVQGLPIIGPVLYSYVVGGFSVTGVTLIRVFSVHVCLGFFILGLLALHVVLLHDTGSNNPLFAPTGRSDVVYFHSYHTNKDAFAVVVVIFFSFLGLWYIPDLVADPDGYIEANTLLTPMSIKPEWYFLAYYAVIRSIESKIGGLVVVSTILFLVWVPTSNSCSAYSVARQSIFWLVCNLFGGLIYLGMCHPEYPYLFICKIYAVALLFVLLGFKALWGSDRVL
uniref:Cytochrome b n=1 Tax=Parabreviscolex niepini TaxID=2041585 RepID=A0A3G2QVA6_9CEST|nr:cytochrome b [Parabreviscolex niepini]AYO27335.1 cytochrome b [Parabreviscolex niepini]